MAAPHEILDLVDRFDRNSESYRSPEYNEATLRVQFLDPFFKALGWDVHNEQGTAEPYKDVLHEESIRVGGATKAPDYCFRYGCVRKFFVEAKRPAVNIALDSAPAFQLRSYAWSAKLPLSILTDFEEFAVYDCRVQPRPNDNPATARIMLLSYTQYAERWEELAAIFSRESVRQGAFDKYVESKKVKKGTQEVDAAFLKEIESWRDKLARSFAQCNPQLTPRELNVAVQRTIDRIIFLRIAEARLIEDHGRLLALTNGEHNYKRLCEHFERADERYNSGLFHFHKERDRAEPPDELTLRLKLDENVLADMIERLYYPISPYEFSVLPADILGQVYEQFLGKVIRLTAGHRAVVDDKPEVKKAGGVYYTPTYIVDYIVQQTVGKLLETKAPRDAAKLRVLDPACGSGSFLIGAYQFLLDWHLKWYTEHDPANHATGRQPKIFQGHGGRWRLTTTERKRILLANIHGVDIDTQAVEVTKLSLLLKVLEGESHESLERQRRLMHERALPDLGRNIKCGNSLIDSHIYNGHQIGMCDEEERYRINVFDWDREFSDAFKAGGFDAIIGNPPYIRIQTMKEWAPIEVEHYKQHYAAARQGNYDIYVVFVERGLSLLNKTGRLGLILPHKFFNAQYGRSLRELLSTGRHLEEIVHFGDHQIFSEATTYTCLLFLSKASRDRLQFTKVDELTEWRVSGRATQARIALSSVTADEWNFAAGDGAALHRRLARMPSKLGDIAHLWVGLQTDADDVFIVEEIRQKGRRVLCRSAATGEEHWFEDEHLKPFLKGSLNVRRYDLSDVNKRLIFPYEVRDGRSELIPEKEYANEFPLTWEYLAANRKRLVARNKGRMGRAWYGYVYKKNHLRFGDSKLLVPSIATGCCFAADLDGTYYFVGSGGGGGGGYGISLNADAAISPLFLLAVLNSSLLDWFLKRVSTPYRGGYLALNRQYIERLPIRLPDCILPDDKLRHDRLAGLSDEMLSLHHRLVAAKTDHAKALTARLIYATDHQIDKLVYDLYGLTEKEIAIVESATASRSAAAE